jgi:hypothetical protein
MDLRSVKDYTTWYEFGIPLWRLMREQAVLGHSFGASSDASVRQSFWRSDEARWTSRLVIEQHRRNLRHRACF